MSPLTFVMKFTVVVKDTAYNVTINSVSDVDKVNLSARVL